MNKLKLDEQVRVIGALEEGCSIRSVVENLRAAVALHFAHYNLVRTHQTLRVTPAMEAGVTNRVWTVAELIGEATAN